MTVWWNFIFLLVAWEAQEEETPHLAGSRTADGARYGLGYGASVSKTHTTDTSLERRGAPV